MITASVRRLIASVSYLSSSFQAPKFLGKTRVTVYVSHAMKVATRDLRLHFSVVEGWLAEGETVTITKSGKRIAVLTKADPILPPRFTFAKRFGSPLPRPGKTTNITKTFIEDRGQ